MLFRRNTINDLSKRQVVNQNVPTPVKSDKRRTLYERIAQGNALAEIEEATYKRQRR